MILCSIIGSVVECLPATQAARVRFQDDAEYILFCIFYHTPFLHNHKDGESLKVLLETGGIDPPTSHMLGECFTI